MVFHWPDNADIHGADPQCLACLVAVLFALRLRGIVPLTDDNVANALD